MSVISVNSTCTDCSDCDDVIMVILLRTDTTWNFIIMQSEQVAAHPEWFIFRIRNALMHTVNANKTQNSICIPRRTLWRYTNVVLLLLLLLL